MCRLRLRARPTGKAVGRDDAPKFLLNLSLTMIYCNCLLSVRLKWTCTRGIRLLFKLFCVNSSTFFCAHKHPRHRVPMYINFFFELLPSLSLSSSFLFLWLYCCSFLKLFTTQQRFQKILFRRPFALVYIRGPETRTAIRMTRKIKGKRDINFVTFSFKIFALVEE